MKLEVKPVVVYAVLIGALIMVVMLVRGCKETRRVNQANELLQATKDSISNILIRSKAHSDSSKKAYEERIEFEQGQKELALAQKERTENDLSALNKQVAAIIDKYKYSKYTDTNAVTVPNEYVANCHDCFTQLESQNSLFNKYKKNVNDLTSKWDQQDNIYKNRINELGAEKKLLSDSIGILNESQQKNIKQLEPHRKMYLSGGVLWHPWPWGVGAGLLYKNKKDVIWGAKWYYSSQGQLIETTINFPLSLRFK